MECKRARALGVPRGRGQKGTSSQKGRFKPRARRASPCWRGSPCVPPAPSSRLRASFLMVSTRRRIRDREILRTQQRKACSQRATDTHGRDLQPLGDERRAAALLMPVLWRLPRRRDAPRTAKFGAEIQLLRWLLALMEATGSASGNYRADLDGAPHLLGAVLGIGTRAGGPVSFRQWRLVCAQRSVPLMCMLVAPHGPPGWPCSWCRRARIREVTP